MMKRYSYILALACIALCSQAQQKNVHGHTYGFLVDPDKPYVYLEIDHVGPREPAREGEPDTGIYFRIRNNCNVPIMVSTFGDDGVMDHVVKNTKDPGDYASTIQHFDQPTGLLGTPDVFLTPEMKKEKEALLKREELKRSQEEAEEREREAIQPPYGYMFPVSTNTLIPPGRQLMFSLPIDQVSDRWHVEIPFWLLLKSRGPYRAPYSYLVLYEDDLLKAKDTRTPSNKPGSPRSGRAVRP